MKHAVSRELFSYWAQLRGGRVAPERGDIDPAAIRTLLSDTFILEVTGAPAAPSFGVRLSGSRLNALFLRELKGEALANLWHPEDRGGLLELLDTVVDDCCPLVVGLRAGPEGHRPIDLEMILLPLKHHGRTHARVLGALPPLEVPSWMGLLGIEGFRTTSYRMLSSDALSVPAATARAQPRRVGHLLVHQGGR